ncbi:MAG: ABC transporter substrate-binding protein [Oscillospiraceae bacterium]|nr:ABC transporter substrate-binding protein [Oscillospiraceae bacterium]
MKKVLALILVLVLAFSFAACKAEETPAEGEQTESADPIIIGSIQDISSETSVMGLMIAQGIRWQVQTINDAGGINGRQIKLVEYDSKANVDESINAYNRLVSEGAVAVIGPHQANIGIALAPISQETKVPIICMGMDNRVTRQGETGTGDPWSYMFLMQPSCDLQGALMAKFAINDLGYKKFGVLYRSDNSYSYSLYYAFEAYCKANGAEIVAVESFQSGDTDFKTMLSKLIASDMEALFCPNYTGELVAITQQARGLGYDGVMINGLDSAPPFNTLCGAEADNVYFISNIRLDDPDVVAVVDAFRAATGNDEPNQINKFCVGYDMIGALASLIAAGATDTESIRTGMENLTGYEGLTGVITLDPTTHQPSGLEMIMHKIENGENVPIKAYTADPVAY